MKKRFNHDVLKAFISLIFIFIINLLLTGCGHSNKISESNKIGLFDISQNDRHLLFSYYKNDESSIYQIDTNGRNLKKIVSSTEEMLFYNPKYSKRENKILFLGRSKSGKDYHSIICIANLDGSGIKKITDGKEIISEAIFSSCEDKIYYCQANEYSKSSPLGYEQAHGVDIFSIDLKSDAIEKITNFNAYGIFHISEYDCHRMLMYMPVPDKEGMVIISKTKPKDYNFIDPANNPRKDLSMYYAPVFSKKYNTLVFIATYELMQMNMDGKNAKVVVNQNIEGHSQIDNVMLLNNKKRLVYTTNSETEFIMVNYDGTDLRYIKLNE